MKSSAYQIIWSCAIEGEQELTLHWLETLAKEDILDYGRLQLDRAMKDIQKTKKYNELILQYFPKQHKESVRSKKGR